MFLGWNQSGSRSKSMEQRFFSTILVMIPIASPIKKGNQPRMKHGCGTAARIVPRHT
jgi:hypothetical protein